MDCNVLNALRVDPSAKSHNDPEITHPNKDTPIAKNNNANNNLNKTDSVGNGRSREQRSKIQNDFPCNPGLMSQAGFEKLTTSSSSGSSSTTRKPETVITVTSVPVCTTALSTIESQSSKRASSISEPAVTTTTAHHPCVTVTTTTTTNTASSSTRLVSEASRNSSSCGSSSNNNNNNNINNNNKKNKNNSRHTESDNTQLQQSGFIAVTTTPDAGCNKAKPEVPPTGTDSSGVNPSDDSRGQDSHPLTKKACDEEAGKKQAENDAAVGKEKQITEQDLNSVVIAPPQESSSTSNFGSSVTPSPVALAVAPITPRTTEGNYSASSKTRHAEITSVCSGNESQTATTPVSEAARSTTTDTSTSVDSTTSGATTTATDRGNERPANYASGGGDSRDPSTESFCEAKQKGCAQYGASASLRGPLSSSSSTVAGQLSSVNRENISISNPKEKQQQQQQQQEQLPMNKSREEEEGAATEEKKGNKEVLYSNTTPSSPPSSLSLLPLPLPQGGELNQPAAAATITTTTTSTTTTTPTTGSAVSIHRKTDDSSPSPRTKLVSHPKSGPVVPYTNSPSSSIPSTTNTASSTLTAPSSSTTTTTLSSSSFSLLVGCNKQPLSLTVTSAKDGCVSYTETSPAESSVQSRNTTTTTTAANCRNALIVQERKADSLASTMCGPSEDKIMHNSSGETSGSTTNTDCTKEKTTRNLQATTTTTTTAKSPVSPVTGQTLLSLSPNFTVTTAATPIVIPTILSLNSLNSTTFAKKLMAPNADSTPKEEEMAVAALSNETPPLVTSSLRSLHESSPSSLLSSSSSSTLLPSSHAPSTSPPLTSVTADKKHKIKDSISAALDNPLKRSCTATGTKNPTRTAAANKAVAPTEGSAASGNSSIHSGSDDSASIQSSPKLGVDSPDSFVALPQTGFESSEFEENTEDSNSNISGGVGGVAGHHSGLNSAYKLDANKDSDRAFDNNISDLLERQRESLVSEATCDMEYYNLKSSKNAYYNDDANSPSSKDFHFSRVYRNIYDSYDCTFSVKNKELDHLLQTSRNKMCSTSSGFVNDLLRCTTAIADDHSYCWSVSKTPESESLLRDAHPCDDEISDSSSLDDIPDQQESLSFLAQYTFSKTSKSKVQNQRNKLSSAGSHKNSGTSFSSGHDHCFDQKSDDDHKVNGLLTPVKYTDSNSVSLTSPKVTPLKGLGGRGSLQASPKVGCFRIGTFASISNLDWDENSDTSSSVGSLSLSDKPREKFTYCRKVDFADKPDVPKSLTSLGEQHYKKGDPGSGSRTGRRHHAADANARMAHILHDHDYCIRTTISPMKSELAKELLSGSKHASCSSKFSTANSSKGSNSSSNSLISFSSSSSSSSSPLSVSYTGITPLTAPPSSTDVKCMRKGRNNSATKLTDGSDQLQESLLSEKADDSSKVSDPNCDAARSNESKLKITGSFQNDYVYFLNKTTRSRRRFSHEILPDKNLQSRSYSDIVIPHLTDADIEALKNKRSHNNNQAADVPVWKSSQDPPGELEADNRLINTVLSMETLCPDPASEHVLPDMIDSAVVPDNPEQYLTPEQMDIIYNAVKEVQITNFKELSPASMLNEDQISPCLANVSDHKNSTDSVVSTIGTSQTSDILATQWSGCNSATDELTKSEVLTTDNNLLDLEYIPMNVMNRIIDTSSDKFKAAHLSCTPGADLPPSDLNALCANNSNSGLTDVHMSSLEKFDLLNLKSDLFPEPAVTDTSISEGNAPWIVTVTMFWNDLPAIMIDNQPYIRLVDIHKQILPAKDTGILKKRCQLLGLEVQNCTEFQRYFLVQYGRAYNSKSTLVISKDDAKLLIGYYVNPPTRIPKGEGCEDEPASPGKRITKTNGSLEGRIKKHGRLMGSRKQSMHKIRNPDCQMNKDKINGEKLEKGDELQQAPGEQKEHQIPQSSSSSGQLGPVPRPIKVKRVSKERHVLSSSMNGKARLRHKKINFLNLIRGETGTSASSSSPAASAAAASATVVTPTSSSSDPTLPVLDLVNPIGDHPENSSIDLSSPTKHQQHKWVVDGRCKSGLKNRISPLQKIADEAFQDLRMSVGAQENSKLKQCNGRIGLPTVARDHTTVPAAGSQQKKKQKNPHQKQFSAFSAVTSKLQPIAKWKNSRNGLGGHGKSSQRKVKQKNKTVTAAATAISNDKMPRPCHALLIYHTDEVPPSDQNPCLQHGKLFLSHYSAKNAKCIKCTSCAKVFSVDEFSQHQHSNPNTNSELVLVSSAQSLRPRDDSNESHQLLWKTFLLKRDQFNSNEHESSRPSPPLRTAGAGVKGPVNSSSSAAAPIITAALTSLSTEINGGNQRSNSTYRVSSRKRKQKQFYPIENYDFKRLPGSAGHGKDSSTLEQFGKWGGKGRGADNQSSYGCSPSKKALAYPNSGSFPSYCLNVNNSTGSNRDGSSLSTNVVTLKNEPELLSFTALENDEYM